MESRAGLLERSRERTTVEESEEREFRRREKRTARRAKSVEDSAEERRTPLGKRRAGIPLEQGERYIFIAGLTAGERTERRDTFS